MRLYLAKGEYYTSATGGNRQRAGPSGCSTRRRSCSTPRKKWSTQTLAATTCSPPCASLVGLRTALRSMFDDDRAALVLAVMTFVPWCDARSLRARSLVY